MNLGEANVVIRPRSTRESLDLAFPFLMRVGGRPYLLLCALVLLPALGVSLGLEAAFGPRLRWLWALALGSWLSGVFTLAAGDLLFAERLRPRTVLRAFWRRLGAYSAGLCCSRALVLLVAPTLFLLPWAWARLLFVPEVLLLEGLPLGDATRRAALLGKATRGGGLALTGWIAGVAGFSVLSALLLSDGILRFMLQLPDAPEPTLSSSYALVGWYASLPITATLRFLRYIDGRTRSDGWDAQVKLQHLAHAAAEST